MTLGVHLCRGNFKSTHAAAGGTNLWPRRCSPMKVDAYFLDTDDERSGDFRPLRFLPKDKIVVLGLITTELGALESKDDIKRRIDEAANTYRSSSWRCHRNAVSRAVITAMTSK